MTGLSIKRQRSNSLLSAKPDYSFGSALSDFLGLSRVVKSQEMSTTTPNYKCVICFETISPGINRSQNTGSCNHQICPLCICSYFFSALKDDRYSSDFTLIQCPDTNCKKNFNTSEFLYKIFNKKEVDAWWRAALAKSHITNKVTCPMNNCNAIFDANLNDLKQCIFTECYECHRGFCMACQQKWHPGVIKIFSDEENLKRTLNHAASNKWSRCPKCNNVVERIAGCIDIRCRCGKNFCYRCGGEMMAHNVCAQNCGVFSETKLASIRESMFTLNQAPSA